MAQTTLPDIRIPQDVERFCISHGILSDLHLAIRLADETFAPIREWQFSVEVDPETDDDAVVIDVRASMPVDEAVERHWRFAEKWTAGASVPARGLIVLLFNPA
ncbi:MAG TPA: hypothetical protein VGI81_13385 [Tepidisphaeraceae bacterium]|jgi:hypothetical protein